jgi:hypothetical protein
MDTRTKKKCVCIEIRDIDKDVLKKREKCAFRSKNDKYLKKTWRD